MNSIEENRPQKKPYRAPCIVDFGDIVSMTGDCWGFCTDGVNGGRWSGPPI